MSVFDGNILTPLAVPDPLTDYLLPMPGALDYGAITTPTALAGTTGVDTALIHGDKWQQLIGQHTENVSQHHKLLIEGNRKEKVVGNHEHTIVGTTNTTHIGVHNQTNIAPRNDTFNHTRTENHAQEEHQNQPTGRKENTKEETTNTETETHMKGFEYNATRTKYEFVFMNLENKATSIGFHGISAEAKLMKHRSEGVEESMQAFATEVVAVKLKAAGSHAKAVLANLNAGVAVNADSPFA